MRALEHVLGLEATELELGWNPPEELDEVDVEERRSHLQRAGHARPIDLHQDVVLEIRLRIEVDQPHEPSSAGRGGIVDASLVGQCVPWRPVKERGSSDAEGPEPRRVARRGRSAAARSEPLQLEVEAEVAGRTGSRSTSGTILAVERGGERGRRPQWVGHERR